MESIDRFVVNTMRGYYADGSIVNGEGKKINGIRKQFCGANILEVTACTTGYCGGDSGHGGRTVISFRDLGGTDIRVIPLHDDYGTGGVEIWLGGDSELSTMIDGLRFAADTLEELAR